MGLEENKAIARRWAQVWSAGNLAIVDDLAAPDLVLSYPSGDIHGPDAFKQFLSGTWYSAFPDMAISVDEVIAEGDKVVCRWTCRGTHQGEFAGIPATGTQVQISGISICRIADGKVVEDRGQDYVLGLLQQLGARPQPE